MQLVNQLKHGLSILAFAFGTHAALAAPVWQINTQGSGIAGASTVSTLSVGGVGLVQPVPVSLTDYSFTENGAYHALTAIGANDITVTYSVSGTGSFVDPSALHMSSGRINLYTDPVFDYGTLAPNYGADNGTLIASFDIVDGFVANSLGQVVVKAKGVAGSFAQGYLFNEAGSDMAFFANVELTLALFNQPLLNPDLAVISGIVCGLAQACPNGYPELSPLAFTVQDIGEVSLAAIPEPASLALILAGLGMVGGLARRRQRLTR